ncbi:MAG: endolytic transglycosylase MltG [Actinomycetia bacterium]|nr:endolytic transglycosylase MltG [Actinomycetes bacterium]
MRTKNNRIKSLARFLIIAAVMFSLCSCFLLDPPQENGKEEIPPGLEVKITIEEGMTLQQIAGLLEGNGVVDNAFLFRLFVQQKGKERNLVPGIYDLITGSKYEDVLEELISGTPVVVYTVTIPEGYTLDDIANKYSTELPFVDADGMEDAVKAYNYNYDYLEGIDSLEGYLFPKTYEITLDYDPVDIVGMMLAQHQFETRDLDYSFASEKGFSRYEIIIIASMIEREAYIPEERELISAVIHNRLDIEMPLGIDATLSYFLEKWEEPLTESDLATDTEYNTRLYAGLPPTPICNPGLASISAALNPADVDYLYFVVTNSETHEHSFTNDYNEHLNNINNAK